MHLPPLQPIKERDYFIRGDVTIHESAAIAPGVLLQADPSSQIVVGAGVCIGMGAILHAQQGTLIIEAEANLGSGVLIVGQGTIGARACVGALSTISNCSIAAGQLVAPGSLLTSNSEQFTAGGHRPTQTSATIESDASGKSESDESSTGSSKPTQVYGLGAFNQLMGSLFPHQQTLNANEHMNGSNSANEHMNGSKPESGG